MVVNTWEGRTHVDKLFPGYAVDELIGGACVKCVVLCKVSLVLVTDISSSRGSMQTSQPFSCRLFKTPTVVVQKCILKLQNLSYNRGDIILLYLGQFIRSVNVKCMFLHQ